MKHTKGIANGGLHTSTLASVLPQRRREGGVCLFQADLSWARDTAPARLSGPSLPRWFTRIDFARIALFALLALAVVGVVVMNGPADAGPNRSASKPLPDPVSEAEVESVIVVDAQHAGQPVARAQTRTERTAAR